MANKQYGTKVSCIPVYFIIFLLFAFYWWILLFVGLNSFLCFTFLSFVLQFCFGSHVESHAPPPKMFVPVTIATYCEFSKILKRFLLYPLKALRNCPLFSKGPEAWPLWTYSHPCHTVSYLHPPLLYVCVNELRSISLGIPKELNISKIYKIPVAPTSLIFSSHVCFVLKMCWFIPTRVKV